MITVTVDKESEYIFIRNAIESGVCNFSSPNFYKAMGIPLRQNVTYHKSDDYVDDIKNKREELEQRFEGKSMSMIQIEHELRNSNIKGENILNNN